MDFTIVTLAALLAIAVVVLAGSATRHRRQRQRPAAPGRENEEAKKTGEALVRQTTEQLYQRFEQVTQAVAQLKGEVGVSGQQLDTLWRALTSPGGSGYFAEIGLANTLKSFGLVEGRDYILQHTTQAPVTDRRLRPHAVVFLPGASVMVIDCKASKFIVEIAQAVGVEEFQG